MDNKFMGAGRLFCGLLLGLLLAGGAQAALINGSVEMSGRWQPIDGNGDPTTIPNATGIDFFLENQLTGFEDDKAAVMGASGDLAALEVVPVADMSDFQFNPLSPNPVPSLWSAGGFKFELQDVSFSVSSIPTIFGAIDFLVVAGNGVLTSFNPLFDPTPGTWLFTGQTLDGVNYSWSSSFTTTVPVPSAIWLFGSAVLGFAGFARRSARR